MKALEYAIVGFIGFYIGILLTLLVNKGSATARKIRRVIKKYKLNTSGSINTETYNTLLDAIEKEISTV